MLEEFWALNRTGFIVDNLLLGDGDIIEQALIVPYMCMVSDDLDQAWRDLNVRANGTRSHLRSLITKDDADDPMVRARVPATHYPAEREY